MDKRVLITVGAIFIFVLAIMFLNYRTGYYSVIFQKPVDARELLRIDNQQFRLSAPMRGLSFSTSFWIYIKDWNYKFMAEKEIFNKGGFKCILTPRSNDLVVEIPIFASKESEKIVFKNVPLQKWLNVAIIVDNRHIDLWINGKIYHSKHLVNLPLFKENRPLLVCDNRGFDGYISSFYYWDKPVSKVVLHRVFRDGPNNNSLVSKILRLYKKIRGMFKVKVSVDLDDNTDVQCTK
tara:strand:- start:459 stop:1166 length:708 start_codon:yes stop_codon:yes gene_type:complete